MSIVYFLPTSYEQITKQINKDALKETKTKIRTGSK